MPTRLRLHQDEDLSPQDRFERGHDGAQAVSTADAPETFLFPLTTVRDRLIAGKVLGDPRKQAPAHGQERQTPNPGVEHASFPFPLQGVQGTQELVGEIERTLARMQDRLDEFRSQLDDTFKFPGAFAGDAHPGPGRDGDPPYLPPAA